ncbi:unnamed protein product [Tilletia controversa]|uniref:Carboxylic ester hydrolase n=3 Tax=Tilletia TaxID=13289 RepID=A0A8X7MPU6_9BASI|nr:hypothetical protein CF336_g1890 [Tilletia laevis]KAE8199050.1 hypothetical protein CF328_g3362 [Tilletia controversa]KAE8261828.1 hypothetical protein A4X03_0g2936 [Tilletia caries]KAE8243295.1 hypothetical protein A4X06_0g6420 [Tilletia controversa]CAD6906307.1 unnamed protein product [Tilletia controversa]
MKGGAISFSLLCLFVCTTLATLATSRSISQRAPLPRAEGAIDPLLIVTTTSGQVRGQASGSLYTYKGIPYGKSTGGSRRFRAPTLASYSNSIIDATAFGPSCPQLVNNASRLVSAFTGSVAPSLDQQSEDCLSANVFVRGSTRAKASSLINGHGGAAVMIWIYGGSFQYGASSSGLYNAQNFVEGQDDVIVVSFNYRTNIFGFPLSPQIQALDASIGYNRGLEDRDLAIDWVHRNIARFGGDPDRITLFGESAGGVSVDTWAFANAGTANPLVKGLIVQSGAVQGLDLSLGNLNPDWTRPLSSWNKVANYPTVKCGLKPDAAQLACMQKVDFSVLLDAIFWSGSDFGPAVDNKRYFDDWEGRSARGQFAKVPTLMGTNADEGTILSGLFLSDLAGMVTQSSLITPLIFTCPAKREVSDRMANGVPAWRYVYHGNWDNMNSGISALGAYHFSEVPLVFKTYPSAYLSDLSHAVEVPAQQNDVSNWMQGAWAAFARNPQRGLVNYGWPTYSPFTNSLANIARNNSAAASFSFPDPVDLGCNLGVPIESSLYKLIRKIGSAL